MFWVKKVLVLQAPPSSSTACSEPPFRRHSITTGVVQSNAGVAQSTTSILQCKRCSVPSTIVDRHQHCSKQSSVLQCHPMLAQPKLASFTADVALGGPQFFGATRSCFFSGHPTFAQPTPIRSGCPLVSRPTLLVPALFLHLPQNPHPTSGWTGRPRPGIHIHQ